VDPGDQQLRRCVLEQKAAGAGLERLVNVFGQAERGQDEHTGRRLVARDAPSRFEPVYTRHADVHEDDVWPQPSRDVDRFDPVTRLCDDLDLLIDFEQLSKARPDESLIISYCDADAQERTVSTGRRAFTA
jgi:hypothetical protein